MASSGSSRRTSKSAVIVPSDVWRVRCVVIEIGTSTSARMPVTISSNVRSNALPPSSRLACTWTTPAPASTARLASLAISAGVYGSFFATLRSRLPLSAATIRIGSAIGGNRIPGPVRAPRRQMLRSAAVASATTREGRRPRQQADRHDARSCRDARCADRPSDRRDEPRWRDRDRGSRQPASIRRRRSRRRRADRSGPRPRPCSSRPGCRRARPHRPASGSGRVRHASRPARASPRAAASGLPPRRPARRSGRAAWPRARGRPPSTPSIGTA